MNKMTTIEAYAQQHKMSKEMVIAKVHAGRLKHRVVDGTTYIVTEAPEPTPTESPEKKPTTAGAVVMMYQRENLQLKERIAKLEAKIDQLIGDKERMLKEERDRIESIYASRDEQLKSFLELVNAKLLKEHAATTPHQEAPVAIASSDNAAVTQECTPDDDTAPTPDLSKRIELREYLAMMNYTPQESKMIKKRFAQAYGNDIRVIQKNGEFLLDFKKYDYTDLLIR